jgi:hypothetical protein
MSKYENIEDLLPLGKKVIRIEPQDKFEPFTDGEVHYNKDGKEIKGNFIKGVQQTRVIKNGRNAGKKFWVFKSPDVIGSNGYPVQINAWDEAQKALFDVGQVEVNVIQGKDFLLDEDGEPVRGADGKSIKKKKAFFNAVRSAEEGVREYAREVCEANPPEEEIPMEDISAMF